MFFICTHRRIVGCCIVAIATGKVKMSNFCNRTCRRNLLQRKAVEDRLGLKMVIRFFRKGNLWLFGEKFRKWCKKFCSLPQLISQNSRLQHLCNTNHFAHATPMLGTCTCTRTCTRRVCTWYNSAFMQRTYEAIDNFARMKNRRIRVT